MEILADWGQIQRKLENAPWGQAGQIVQIYANRFNCSKDKIYYELRKRFGKKKTVERAKQVDPDNQLMQIVFDLKTYGEQLTNQSRELATKTAVRQMYQMGVEGVEALIVMDENGNPARDRFDGGIKVKVSTINRRINEMGFREQQPNVRIESAYANQVHMIDFSRSKYFQLFDYDARQDDYMLEVSGRGLYYKKENARLRTWIVQYMDDYSRLRKVKCYAETNESAFLGLDHLNWCWNPASGDDHLLQYLPLEMFRSDNGSFRKARETQTAMEAMGVNLTKQMPGRKGGTAKVENRFKSLWQQFELPLASQLGEGNRIWLSNYNELLEEFCIKEHKWQHPVHKNYSRGEWYKKGLADRSVTQRTADVDLLRVACTVEKRKVDDHLRISLNNEYWSVPQYVEGIPTTDKKIYVHENKYGELTGKLIDDLATGSFELEPWSASQWGTFESYKQTPKRRREEDFEREQPHYNEIMGADVKRETADEETADGRRETAAENVRYLGPDTQDVEPDSPFNDHIEATGRVFRKEIDARAYIGTRMEAWGLGFNDVSHYFEDVLDGFPVTQRAIDEVINAIHADYDNGDLAITA